MTDNDNDKESFIRQDPYYKQLKRDMEEAILISQCNDHLKPLRFCGPSRFHSYDDVLKVHNIISGRITEPYVGARNYLSNILIGK